MTPKLLISFDLYACRTAYISSIIRFSLVVLPLDVMLDKLLDSVNACTGIGCLKTNSNSLRVENAF